MSAKDKAPAVNEGQITTTNIIVTPTADSAVTSRQVSWWPVWQFVDGWLAGGFAAGPIVGTPAWCELSDDDPAKLASVVAAGMWWTLEQDARQEQMAQASRDISAAADWSQVAREIQQRRAVYIRRAS